MKGIHTQASMSAMLKRAIQGVVKKAGLSQPRCRANVAAGPKRYSISDLPIIQLTAPLRFRPVTPGDPSVANLVVRCEGVFLTRATTMSATDPLIARAAVARLELDGCTLDPGGSSMMSLADTRDPYLIRYTRSGEVIANHALATGGTDRRIDAITGLLLAPVTTG